MHQDIGSGIAAALNGIFIFGKFVLFFAFLFGVSFQLQTNSLDSRGIPATPFLLRRLLLLLGIGLLHSIFWIGDILSIYASLGLSLGFFRGRTDRFLLVSAVLLILTVPNLLWNTINLIFLHNEIYPDMTSGNEAYHELLQNGGVWEISSYILGRLDWKIYFQLMGGRGSATLGFFLLGMWVGRKGWLQANDENKGTLTRLLIGSSILFGVLFIVIGVSFALNGALGWNLQENKVAQTFFPILFHLFNATAVVIYVTALLRLLYLRFWQRILTPLQYVGKLALTSYLMQSVIGLLLFYPYGLGWYLKTSPFQNVLIALGVFAIQAILSAFWLKRFYYGPIEWLWRSATAGKWQRFSRNMVV
jgi:uncharacterized protein